MAHSPRIVTQPSHTTFSPSATEGYSSTLSQGVVTMLNRVQLIGHLGANPETRFFPNTGERYVKFRLAATERWKDRETGERKELTEWINIVAYRPGLVSVIEQYLKTGARV